MSHMTSRLPLYLQRKPGASHADDPIIVNPLQIPKIYGNESLFIQKELVSC